MFPKQLITLALLAFRSPLTAAISPNEECGCTKTIYKTITETATEISGQSSSIEAPSALPYSSTTTGYLTFTETSTETVIATLSRTTTTLTSRLPPITVTLPPSEPSEMSVPTGSQTGVADGQPSLPLSSISSIATLLTTSPKPPYANSTTSRSGCRSNGTSVSTSISSPTSYTASEIYTSNTASIQLSTTETGYTPSTLQTSVSNSNSGASNTADPNLSSSYIQNTTQLPFSSQTSTSVPSTPLSSSAGYTSGVPGFTQGHPAMDISTSSEIIYTYETSSATRFPPSYTASPQPTASSSATIDPITTPAAPSPTSLQTTTLKQYYTYNPPEDMQRRHRGGYENAREGEGPWANA
ncbi:hypothetical protein HYFRA_00005727 [Hymenoscyphus fraxineus]|uniref:Uncharacterized protein n=1 Tax=Hymenoscyphus fraxineus TaxID=746836 RepID=A0A9N9PRX3_9HELO|nr:hypothetical protein HYFRA_00005727 [Hymenoscyphus fraxineus]